MRKKDILELKKRFKKDHCTFTKMCGCYVDGNKNIVLNFRETFLNLDEDEYFKYLEIAKKVLSGTIGNNILELNFPMTTEGVNEHQASLMALKSSALKNDDMIESFYKLVIESYDYTGNFLILLFHDAYDVITKTNDNSKVDESEEVYEYILCAICPVSLSKPGLRYFEDENTIKARLRDWVVETPNLGFVFPAFIDRSSDVNSIMYYTKNAKDPHPELMENALGCPSKQTATIQKESFQAIIKDSMGYDEKKAEDLFMEIQENLNTLVEDYNAIYDDTDVDPMVLDKTEMQSLLVDSGVPKELTSQIEESFSEIFGDTPPLAESLIDNKALQIKAQKRKEEKLEKQVEVLQNRLEEVKKEVAVDSSTETNNSNDTTAINEINNNEPNTISSEEDNNLSAPTSSENFPLEMLGASEDEIIQEPIKEIVETPIEEIIKYNADNSDFDVILQVKPKKIPQIKSQIINGQKCIVIPIEDNEQTTIKGFELE